MIGATQAYSAGKFAEGLPFPQAIGKLVPEPPTATPIETSKKLGETDLKKNYWKVCSISTLPSRIVFQIQISIPGSAFGQ